MAKDRTQNNLENNLDGFERTLRALLLSGMAVHAAVKVAYRRYPVMRHLYKDLLDDLVGDFAEGYGKKQAAAKFEHEAISAAMNKSWTDDGVNLSDRMYKNSKKVQAESAEVSRQPRRPRSYSTGTVKAALSLSKIYPNLFKR